MNVSDCRPRTTRIQISQIACEMGYFMIQEYQQRHSKLYINNHSIVTLKGYKWFHFLPRAQSLAQEDLSHFKGLSHAGCRRFRELKLVSSSQLMVQFCYIRLKLFLAVCCNNGGDGYRLKVETASLGEVELLMPCLQNASDIAPLKLHWWLSFHDSCTLYP